MGDTRVQGLYAALHAAFPSLPITPKILLRPPFPLLHTVCVTAFGDIGVFSATQLSLARVTTRELKAAFLTRALALVTFALEATKPRGDYVSVLFLVSPVQVLAGLEVDRTHEFLHQIVVAARLPRAALATATERVTTTGERRLYTTAVTFRRGLMQGQAAVRRFLARKRLEPAVGTRFLKEFDGFGVFEGVVQSKAGSTYVLSYPADGDEEELELDELLRVLARSHELEALQETSKNEANDTPTEAMDIPTEASAGKETLPTDNNLFKALEAELRATATVTETTTSTVDDDTNQHQEPPMPAWRAKLLTLMSTETSSHDINNEVTSSSEKEPPVRLDEAAILSLAPPSLPKLQVPGGHAQWAKRLKLSKGTSVPRLPAVTSSQPLPKAAVARPSPRPNNQKQSPPRHKALLHSLGDPHEHTFHDYESRGKSKIIYKIIQRIDRHLRRKHLRVIDLFRYCDADSSGGISRDELEDVLKQLDIQLPPAELHVVMAHLDKNGNGVLDIDEFESLVRMNRRTDARRDQLRREFPHVVHSALEASHQMLLDNWAINVKKLLPYKDVILSAARAVDKAETGSIPVAALHHILRSISMPKVRKEILDDFLTLVRPVHNLVLVSAIESVFADKPKRDNKFLDHTWLAQFDAQMDKVRDLGL
ncbi:hypothetical protein SPRG_01910 [Saprolegnia parasitica CBS 223.65]|uniref:EF-hand domain-containing protein n=1 Tax=Saprolegnia parasitica (strain CBS 223.65) TaxID=695850 RepID=A0A067CRG8_SAPPC|nr:hypothetical protein SPRG_01910 [Saprolegnia parasitica CBS 223.65]KDO33098.1 hypothetical protein SPRG_01910 [Saprolegnia parasitica CBS 223.65]|eukprot:XP_012195866.1 hypothetical protein SPRG_01910 [Saprolegnia parasitica CBS 223.65]